MLLGDPDQPEGEVANVEQLRRLVRRVWHQHGAVGCHLRQLRCARRGKGFADDVAQLIVFPGSNANPKPDQR